MNILLVSPMADQQSGKYLHDSLLEHGNRIAWFDWREVIKVKGVDGMNKELIKVVDHLKPHFTFIIKGGGITADTIKKIREVHDHVIEGWIFDVTLGGQYVKNVPEYTDMLKELDLFYTMDEDAVPELTELGINCKWLPQACYPKMHGEEVLNSVQKRKYGADIVFMGSVGSIHPNREKLLKRIADEGFDFKIYGEVLYPKGQDPDWVKDHHTGFSVINDMHSVVCNSSKIVIGLDGWPHREKSYSMRLYKVLCSGSFYLTTATKGMEKVFVPGKHLDVYKDGDELVSKIIEYLSDEEKREKVSKSGQKLVLDEHTYLLRMATVLEDVNKLLEEKGIKLE